MPARRRLVAGNWKMNGTLAEARSLASDLRSALKSPGPADVLVCPPFTALAVVSDALRGSHIAWGGQNMYFEDKGAFTGEVSPLMLLDLGCTYVILGHSERRRQMGEGSDLVNRKARLSLKHGLTPIVCVGETLDERQAGRMEAVIRQQLDDSLADLDGAALGSVLLAYEPVWAIGTGQVATPEQAEEVHRFIRSALPGGAGAWMRILYGGSVTPENAAGLLVREDIDGALVGGASLKAESFAAIVQAAG
ncbi:MAG: triose-phosphate isomerase [Chloroflexi bacterium]|nr:triose-phosphate isomerase [Chloroflexota bacterium]